MKPVGAAHATRTPCNARPIVRPTRSYAVPSVLLLFSFFACALLFCTSMLSTSTVLPNTANETCDGVQPVDQVVVLLVDAMRPDFVLSALRRYSREDGGCRLEARATGTTDAAYYSGPTLRYMEESLNNSHDASHGFFLVADAPTTTAQRIKAIATGVMPAFLEAGSNFNSEATPLDSFIRQAAGRAVLLGDDTWLKLFPNPGHWKEFVAIPSFDVADFHTNDNAVLSKIFTVLNSETREQDHATVEHDGMDAQRVPYAKLIVAHFLGIDHVGHRYNAKNRFMDDKLTQLNAMLRNVSRTLRQRATSMNTMLLVLGDHGMTHSGNHGGDSALETDTFLFAQLFRGSAQLPASHRRPNDLSAMTAMSAGKAARKAALAASRQTEKADEELQRLDTCRTAAAVDPTQLGAANQVDITPTVSVLLGAPIPFSSLGRVIPEVLALADEHVKIEEVERCNERQMQRSFNASNTPSPANAPWVQTSERRGGSARQRIAAMSHYARRTRTEMSLVGMATSGLLMIAVAVSPLASRDLQSSLRHADTVGILTVAIVILRWATTFANSFIVNEDVEVFGLLTVLTLLICVARAVRTRSQLSHDGRTVSVVSALLRETVCRYTLCTLCVVRVFLPLVLRRRYHITHAVESSSALDGLIQPLMWGNCQVVTKRVGILVGGALWSAVEQHVVARRALCARQAPTTHSSAASPSPDLRRVSWLLAGVSVGAMMAAFQVPIAHHLVPVACSVAYAAIAPRQRVAGLSLRSLVTVREYVYFMWVLWTASLCNEQVVASVVIAVYGTLLPAFAASLRVVDPAVRGIVLHLSAFTAFFMEGHQCMLNTIDWNASFVGLPAYNLHLSGALVLCRTFNAFLLLPVACTVASYFPSPDSAAAISTARLSPPAGHDAAMTRDAEKRTGDPTAAQHTATSQGNPSDTTSYLCFVVLASTVVQATLSACSAFIQRNHLMLFPIYCPKLLFDVVISLLTGAGVLLSML